MWWKVSLRRPCIVSNLWEDFLFFLNSHDYTVGLIAALQCRPTEANKGSMLIYSDIYFNIDNVVSSRPFFLIKPNPRSLGLNVRNERCAGVSELAFMIYFSTASPAKEMCIVTKNKLPPPPEVPPRWMWTNLTPAAVSALRGSCMFMVDCHLVWEICKWLADSQVCLANM